MCRREGGAQRALAWFHRQTAVITGTLLQEYKELFEAGADGDKSTVDERLEYTQIYQLYNIMLLIC